MASDSPPQLRVLIADGREGRAERVASVVAGLGHDVIARDTTLSDVGEHTAAERPDVALVILGESSQQALDQSVWQSLSPSTRVISVPAARAAPMRERP